MNEKQPTKKAKKEAEKDEAKEVQARAMSGMKCKVTLRTAIAAPAKQAGAPPAAAAASSEASADQGESDLGAADESFDAEVAAEKADSGVLVKLENKTTPKRVRRQSAVVQATEMMKDAVGELADRRAKERQEARIEELKLLEERDKKKLRQDAEEAQRNREHALQLKQM